VLDYLYSDFIFELDNPHDLDAFCQMIEPPNFKRLRRMHLTLDHEFYNFPLWVDTLRRCPIELSYRKLVGWDCNLCNFGTEWAEATNTIADIKKDGRKAVLDV
jgi:hypothetical protein